MIDKVTSIMLLVAIICVFGSGAFVIYQLEETKRECIRTPSCEIRVVKQ